MIQNSSMDIVEFSINYAIDIKRASRSSKYSPDVVCIIPEKVIEIVGDIFKF